jgi:uncharacterized coiled-coil DUF342 family protein
MRTASEGKKVQELHEEVVQIMGRWQEIYQQIIRLFFH